MKILFFIVHQAKFWMFRKTVNELKRRGHTVEFAIVTKDKLEENVKAEGWDYVNIMPKGRVVNWLPRKLGAMFLEGITLWKLFWYTFGKHYDLFITTDALAFLGWIRRVPTLVFFDDDFEVIKEYFGILAAATKIVTPAVTDMGPYKKKQITYKGNHQWATVHPKYFKPDINVVKEFNPKLERYFLLRLVALNATHDTGKKGISDEKLRKIIQVLSKYGKVYLNTEKSRELPEDLEKYRLPTPSYQIHSVMYYADMFIADSQSMISEAALMGTPAIRFSGFVGRINYLKEEEKYGLTYGFKTDQFDKMLVKIEELAKQKNLKKQWKVKVDKWAKDHIDPNEFYINLIESYGKKSKR